MIYGAGAATRIYLAAGATDIRKGFDGLYGLVRDRMELDPQSGHVFCFCNRRRTRLKLLYFDGSGLWVCAKRLEKGCFRWPAAGAGEATVKLNAAELAQLLGGLDLTEARPRRWYRHEAGAA